MTNTEYKKLAIQWFRNTFPLVKEFRNGTYIYSDCPECGKDRFFLDTNTARVKCWKCYPDALPFTVFAKQMGYHIDYNLDLLTDLPIFVRPKFVSTNVLPPKCISLLEAPNDSPVIQYLKNRGLSKKAFDYMRAECFVQTEYLPHPFDDQHYFGRVIIPLYNLNLDMKAFLARDFTGKTLKHKDFRGVIKSEMPFNIKSLITNDHIYLTEGAFDAAFFGEQGLATNQFTISDYIAGLIIEYVKEVTVIPDVGFTKKGTMYNSWRSQIIRLFSNSNIKFNLVKLLEIPFKNGAYSTEKIYNQDLNSLHKLFGWDYIQEKLDSAEVIQMKKRIIYE
jgi:hypothetical protein